jgi:hypothetical protein
MAFAKCNIARAPHSTSSARGRAAAPLNDGSCGVTSDSAFHEFDNRENNCARTRRRWRTYVELTRPLVFVTQQAFVRADSRYGRIPDGRGVARSHRAIAQSLADEQHQTLVAHPACAFAGFLETSCADCRTSPVWRRACHAPTLSRHRPVPWLKRVRPRLGFGIPTPRIERNADDGADPGADCCADDYADRHA